MRADEETVEWRFAELKRIVEARGGRLICRSGDRVLIRLDSDEYWLNYTGPRR
jgi:hypothetical protein